MMHDAKLDGKINVYLNVHKVTVRSLCILAYHTRCFDPSSYFIFITNDYVRHTYFYQCFLLAKSGVSSLCLTTFATIMYSAGIALRA